MSARLFCLLVLIRGINGFVENERRKIYEDRLTSLQSRNINRLVPPFPATGPISIAVIFQIHRIISLNSDSSTLSVSGVIQLAWKDRRYAWNSSLPPNSLLYPARQMWVPELTLSTSADFDIRFGRPNDVDQVLVRYDGRAVVERAMDVTVACNMNVHYFPRDLQHCTLVFLPPSTHQGFLVLCPYPNVTSAPLPTIGDEWKILASVHRFAKAPTVHANGSVVNIGAYKVDLLLYRNSSFYILTIIIPSIMLSLVTLVPFILPPSQSAPKIVIPISTFLSFNIYMLLLEKILPRASSVPVLGQSYAALLAVCLITDVFQAVSVKFYHCRIKVIPRPVAILYLRFFAFIFCFRVCHGTGKLEKDPESAEIEDTPLETDMEESVFKQWLIIGRINDRVGLLLSASVVTLAFLHLFTSCFSGRDIPPVFQDVLGTKTVHK